MYSVFIIDDEKHCIIDLERSIPWENYGFQVKSVFQNPEEAETAILSYKPHVVFTDVKMPRLTGLKLIENARKAGYSGEFVIVSGYDDFEYAKKAIHHQVAGYCLKPVDEEEVISLLVELKKKLNNSPVAFDNNWQTSNGVLVDILEYIDLKMHNKLTLPEVSEKFNTSVSYCTKLFKNHLNKTFSQYVAERRIECAKELLSQTDFTVQEVAFKTGFDDYFYFTKKFKSLMGVTPSSYRKQGIK